MNKYTGRIGRRISRAFTLIALMLVLVILGVLAAKLVVLTAGQAIPFFQAETTYIPTLVEFGGVVGILGLAGLLFLLGKRLLRPKAA